MAKTRREIEVDALRHQDKRRNIPTAELEPVMDEKDKTPIRLAYERRNRDLDPQLVWRGKDEQDWSDLIVQAPPLYIQEKVHPKVLVDDLLRQSKARAKETTPPMPDLFADFNGLPDREALTEFYQHDANWSNRMISGDSLSVMASLAEREGLRGKVQCIYFDPPYGIRFNSNFQWSTTSRDVKDGSKDHITREPEQVRAFRDTWRDGIHSYLTYLRDRLTVARDLLADSGSIFVQIGDENVHRVRAVMDEVFGDQNLVAEIVVEKTSGASMEYVDRVADFILWYGKSVDRAKYRAAFQEKELSAFSYEYKFLQDEAGYRNTNKRFDESSDERLVYSVKPLTSQTNASTTIYEYDFHGRKYQSGRRQWATPIHGMDRIVKANRVEVRASSIGFVRFFHDFSVVPISNIWTDTGTGSFTDPKVFIVQTGTKIVQRCILMSTDPGDLVLDPTCGSGTTAYVAEQWGRRWITVDTSRVALALARARIMGARYPYYLLADSPEGQKKEGAVSRTPPRETPTHGDIRQGFVYERVPHITLKSIANNAEIDVIWEKWQETLEPLRANLNAALGKDWQGWEIPREAGDPWPANAAKLWAFAKGKNEPNEIQKAIGAINAALGRHYTLDTLPDAPRDPWPHEPTALHSEWWQARIAHQKEIDASIDAKAEFESLYDKPYPDNSRIRVAGPFTVESLSPHRVVAVDQDDSLLHEIAEPGAGWEDFGQMVFDHLKTAGVQQAHKEDRIAFTALIPWPGKLISAEGRYSDGEHEHRAAILIGPEFGIVSRPDLVDAAREAADAGFDVVIACAFNFDARSAELDRIGRIPILKARMNPDLHMAGELKNTDFAPAPGFLDAHLHYEDQVLSLRKTIAKAFVIPIAQNAHLVARGGSLPRSTPMSAILFGPPGTSKTQLAKIISDFLRWPLLLVDPSYLVQEGLDRIQAMANRLFSMLTMAEQIVVLLDEFDEMGRDRSRNQEVLSRFITTAMLPKLARINEERKLVFLLATNYVSGFDAAFSRGGRFDMLIQIMPPSFDAKLARWPSLEGVFAKLRGKTKQTASFQLGDLTYLETEQLLRNLNADMRAVEIAKQIGTASAKGTLNKPNEIDWKPEEGGPDEQTGDTGQIAPNRSAAKTFTWKDTCEAERGQIRLPGL